MMKVKELIEKLQACSPEADVMIEYNVLDSNDSGGTVFSHDEEVIVERVNDLETRVVLSVF